MSRVPTLVAREQELADLLAVIRDACEGNGGLVLMAGEAGVGKTRLAHEAATASGAIVLAGGASPDGTPAYGPVVEALRAGLRLGANRGLHPTLALLMPELGPPPREAAPAAILEALRQGFASMAERAPAIVVLDDLQWADETTLVDVLPMLAASLMSVPLLVIGIYRSDDVPRGHSAPTAPPRPAESRAAARVRAAARSTRPGRPRSPARWSTELSSPSLAAALHERTEGVPFFIEELAGALAASGRLHAGERGVELAAGEPVPLPDTVRDAVLLRAASLSDEARALLEVAAIAGVSFALPLLVELGGESGLDEALQAGRHRRDGLGCRLVPPCAHARGALPGRALGAAARTASPLRRSADAARSELRAGRRALARGPRRPRTRRSHRRLAGVRGGPRVPRRAARRQARTRVVARGRGRERSSLAAARDRPLRAAVGRARRRDRRLARGGRRSPAGERSRRASAR